MHICTHSAHVTSSPHYLWSLLSQPQLWPMWDPGTLQVETEGTLQAGSTLLVTQQDGTRHTWTVLEVQKPERLVLHRPQGRGTEVRIVWEIGQQGEEVHLQQVTTLSGPLLQVLGRARDKGVLQQASAMQFEGLVNALKGKHRSSSQGDRTNTPSAS